MCAEWSRGLFKSTGNLANKTGKTIIDGWHALNGDRMKASRCVNGEKQRCQEWKRDRPEIPECAMEPREAQAFLCLSQVKHKVNQMNLKPSCIQPTAVTRLTNPVNASFSALNGWNGPKEKRQSGKGSRREQGGSRSWEEFSSQTPTEFIPSDSRDYRRWDFPSFHLSLLFPLCFACTITRKWRVTLFSSIQCAQVSFSILTVPRTHK